MSKDRDRTVYRRDGEWINKRNDSDRASSKHKTQGEAVDAAREMLGNQGGGIRLTYDSNHVQIGGTDEEKNQIAYNGTDGHNFAGVLINNSDQGITVRNNSIHDNIGLGIDLNFGGTFHEGDGVTVNDCFDPDNGANGLQNYPELLAPVFAADRHGRVVKELKQLQETLGDFQDGEVQRDAVRGAAAELLRSRPPDDRLARSLLAMGRLAGEMDTRQARAREAFSDRWVRFSAPGNLADLAALGGRR